MEQKIFDIRDVEPGNKPGDRLNILLVCDDKHESNAVMDHIRAFSLYSRHNVVLYNPLQMKQRWLVGFDEYDVLLIHYSIFILGEYFLSRQLSLDIRNYNGLKMLIIGDEYRYINDMVDKIADLGIDVLFSSLSTDNIGKVYGADVLKHVIKVSKLPGYVPENLVKFNSPPVKERKYHVTYRARELPFWLGDHSRLKHVIAEQFPALIGEKYELIYDVSAKENERLYGKKWIRFLCESKAVLGTEGGASIFDFDGSAERDVLAYMADHPQADYDEVRENVLTRYEGNVVHKTITPRVFECIALKVAMVMFPGDYSGVLKPWEHYIPLNEDFSNAAEVAELLKDDSYLQNLVDRVYRDVIETSQYSMESFIHKVDCVVDFAVREKAVQNNVDQQATGRSNRAGVLFKFRLISLAFLERIIRTVVVRYTTTRLNFNEWLTAKLHQWVPRK